MPRARIPQLDGLRAVAIAAVMAHHLFHIPLLWGGVDLFFVLSGFLITGLLVDAKASPFPSYLGHFYARRARRILPAYLVILLLTACIFGFGFLDYWPYYLGAMNFLEPLGLPMPDTLQPLWSLAVEEQFYLLWPLAVFFLPRRALAWLAGALLILAPILRYTCTPFFALHWAIYMLLPFRMDTLAAGALLALLLPRISAQQTLRKPIVIACLLASAVALLGLRLLQLHGDTTTSNTPIANVAIYECVLILATALLILTLQDFGRALFASSPMVAIGRISYSMYLVHLTAFWLVAPNQKLSAVAATIVYATVLWFTVERPLLKTANSSP